MSSLRVLKLSLTVIFTITAVQVFDSTNTSSRAGDDSGSGTNYYAGLNCGQLWYERNSIFASNGYCFKSRRAIATFGRRCHTPYGRLPNHLRRVVSEIKGWERHRRCR